MENLSIQTSDSGNIATALGISDARLEEIQAAFEKAFDAGFDGKRPSIRMTDLAQEVVNTLSPNSNELFFIGVKMGEMVERQAMIREMMPSAEDMLGSLLGGMPKGEA